MPLQVLLVEDDPDDAFFATRALTSDARRKFAVTHARSLGEALAILAVQPAELVLVDLKLPDSDGVATVEQILEAADSAAVVVLTGCEDEATGEAAVQLGAQDYVVKGTADVARLPRTATFAVERKRLMDTMEHAALHDALTGLANRALFEDRVARAIAGAQRYDQGFAVAYLDLDKFKPVNDTLGHRAGDQVLVSVARRLRAHVRAVDTVARLGGDEFGCLLTRVGSVDQALTAARRLARAIAQPCAVVAQDGHEREATVGVSVGVALFPGDADTRAALLARADQLMYAAKRRGGGIAVSSDGAEPHLEEQSEPR